MLRQVQKTPGLPCGCVRRELASAVAAGRGSNIIFIKADGPGHADVAVNGGGDWKLLEFFEDGRLELYDPRDDAGETRNPAAAQPWRAKQLQARLAAWRAETGAKMPSPHKAGERAEDFGEGGGD